MKDQLSPREIEGTQDLIANLRGILGIVETAMAIYPEGQYKKALEAQRADLLQDINALQLSIWNYE
jgi:hypothetical protein